MKVQKRDGSYEEVSFDKVLRRIRNKCHELQIDPTRVAQLVCSRIYDGVKTSELDELTSQICTSMMTEHLDYGTLASRIIISNHHKNTSPSFSEVVDFLFKNTTLLSKEYHSLVMHHKEKLNQVIDYERDYLFDYFGFKTLERAYLLKHNDKVMERPQHMFMRVALAIHGESIREAIETYEWMSRKYFIHATPTLFNAGSPNSQFSSCFLVEIDDDSVDGMYKTIHDVAMISKYAGGIGLHISKIRGNHALIKTTGGKSNGIVPLLRVLNGTARHISQGGRRAGSFAIYLEPWHSDILEFLEMKKNQGNEEERARDLFYALWIPDLFMKCVKEDREWYLMSPDVSPGLQDVYDDEFDTLYHQYVREGKYVKKMMARDVWKAILTSQIETGTPYMLYKDHVNRKNNQMNLGTIKSSNLCCEITEYTSKDEQSVCNLMSLALPTMIENGQFNFERLKQMVTIGTRNLNKVIDRNFYPTKETERSNLRHRPIGIGVQGLADVFALLRMPFESPEAMELNRRIFETIYYSALETSMHIARERTEYIHKNGIVMRNERYNMYSLIQEELPHQHKSYAGAYSSFEGSPASKGILQYDMWNVEPITEYDWKRLKENIMKYGLRNSLLIAPMPTASTSQILGFNECFEPFTSNIYSRRTLAGEFVIVNKYLIRDLQKLGLWNLEMKNKIIRDNGSIQNISEIPDDIKELYKSVWEMKQKNLIDMAASRGAFICQSQSMNIFMENANHSKLTSCHFYTWEKGLKTGQYYLRTRSIAKAQQFTIEPEKKVEEKRKPTEEEKKACSIKNREECMLCSS